jgi:anti-anti-sigma regulatory factor
MSLERCTYQGPSTDELRFIRLPGLYGPILRCEGRLEGAAAGRLRHATRLLAPLRHPAVILDLSGLERIDAGGIAALREIWQAWPLTRTHLILVAGTGAAASRLSAAGLSREMLIVSSEEDALDMLEFLYGPRTWPEGSWDTAQRASLAWWKSLEQNLEILGPVEAARRLTSMHPLCEMSEQVVRLDGEPWMTRCEFCPFFADLGGRQADLGCDSVVAPILEALAGNALPEARAGIRRVIERFSTGEEDEGREVPVEFGGDQPALADLSRPEEPVNLSRVVHGVRG